MTTYTTTTGKTLPLTPKLWRGIKRKAQHRFDGSIELFNACWRQYRGYADGATDDPACIDDVMGWMETLASERVNDSGSRFYIYG